uniref:Outer membrane protein TolC n=1 Tax=Candidatus Kentrum sp. FM TaxID=2126340 RepID=A0A450W3N2_9GAMM|nr:MAG: Outer membrane protein TolC [Candidatus Kentron sp. FM]VFJ71975.1 MAG: Outer membrane protein TolC [Candidatus Kentron sp. FM]VFK11642.1 MAG: Outer membrane protein TolC [Candidatus Kentron sp. FM]
MANPTTACGNPFRLSSLSRLFMLILFTVLLSACAVTPEPLTEDELTQQAEEDRDLLFIASGSGESIEPPPEVLTLPWAITRALKYNLDHRIKAMKEALALGQLDIDKFDLLPELVASAEYYDRSEYDAARNMGIDGEETTIASYSSEKDYPSSSLTLSWNILDFGISYYTAKQGADRVLIARERRRKVIHNLIQEVSFAYWRVVAHQQLREEIGATIELARKELKEAEKQEHQNIKPLEALRDQKMLLKNIARLESMEREFSTAYIELAELIRAQPEEIGKIRVAAPELGNSGYSKCPKWKYYEPDKLTDLAFRKNPDILEKAYQSRIAVQETRKAILGLLPGITLTGSQQYNGNDFLEDKSWHEWSTELTWNLLNILQAPTRIEHAESGEKLAETQRLALRMAVLAQVHLAIRQFQHVSEEFEQADNLFRVTQRIADHVTKRGKHGKNSGRDAVYEKTSEITAQLERYQVYAELQAADRQLHATIGIDIAPPAMTSRDPEEVAAAVENRLRAWERGDLLKRVMAGNDLADNMVFPKETSIDRHSRILIPEGIGRCDSPSRIPPGKKEVSFLRLARKLPPGGKAVFK